MEILPLHFKTLSYCGIWSESDNFSLFKSVYKFLVIFVIFHFTISAVLEFVRISGFEDDSIQGLFVSTTYMALCLKIINFISHQKDMSNLLKKYRSKICQANSPEEWKILKKFTQKIERIFVTIMILSQMSGFTFAIFPILKSDFGNLTLPFKTYQPFEVSNNALSISTYALQILAIVYGVLLNVSFDTMVYGFILLSCAQYEIFCLRLTKFGNKNEMYFMKNYVDHHVLIQDFIRSTQSFFMRAVTPLFFFSLITLGASIFKIIQLNLLSIEFFVVALYLTCMLFQIFLYCWHGNELTEKSKTVTDAAYSSNWMNLDPTDRKSLKFVMQMSAKGNIISHYGQCTLNLNTFVWIMKMSYSALNVLQRGVK